MERIQKALEKASQQRPMQSSYVDYLHSHSVVIDDIAYHETQSIPCNKATLIKNRVVAAAKNDPRSDIFRILRTKILQRLRSNNSNVIAISSPTSNNGKSLIAVNLAVSIAMDANYSVLLADFDLRHPSVHEYFGISPEFGLTHYLEEDKPLSELLINPGIERLVILPAGQSTHSSSELLSTPKMLALAAELKHRYPNRIVVVDLPPLLISDDALSFAPNVDALVLVVAEGENTKDEVERSVQLIDPEKFLGTILNKSADIRPSEYSYY